MLNKNKSEAGCWKYLRLQTFFDKYFTFTNLKCKHLSHKYLCECNALVGKTNLPSARKLKAATYLQGKHTKTGDD